MSATNKKKVNFYVNSDGDKPVADWPKKLKRKGKHFEVSKINSRINRLKGGNYGDHKFFDGIGELIIDYGPGYRVYFGEEGDKFLLLLCGGTKDSQTENIAEAKLVWEKCKKDKKKPRRSKLKMKIKKIVLMIIFMKNSVQVMKWFSFTSKTLLKIQAHLKMEMIMIT